MRRCLVLLVLFVVTAARAEEEAVVTARDWGYVTQCAEQDNVVIALDGMVRRFEVRARHPFYFPAVEEHSKVADFSNCVWPEQPVWHFDLQSHVLYEDAFIRLQGHRLRDSWRPELVDVSVGARTWPGLHLLQLLVKRPTGDEEILVLYPADGYWRAKPLAPDGHPETPYGTSFLFGPIETDRRPLVKLSGVRFDPVAMTFRVDYVAGGHGELAILSAGPDELVLEAWMSGEVTGGPFAMVSSMYVAEDNADIGRMRVRRGAYWSRHPVVAFAPVSGQAFAFGRDTPSRHNTLAPDMILGPFLP